MKFLLDTAPHNIEPGELVAGQLLTPLTNYRLGDGVFAVDNGAYSRFNRAGFLRLLEKCEPGLDRCLFVSCPDVVGSAMRTLEVFHQWHSLIHRWPVALVGQDGVEDLPIPWEMVDAIFIGGSTDWKMSQAAADCIKAAQILGKHVHIGRVNTVSRFRYFEELGADTCDGSGVVRFSWMMERIASGAQDDARYLPGCDPVRETDTGAPEAGDGCSVG